MSMEDVEILAVAKKFAKKYAQDGTIHSISVNGASQTITDEGAVNLDVADNLITDSQWTALASLWAVE